MVSHFCFVDLWDLAVEADINLTSTMSPKDMKETIFSSDLNNDNTDHSGGSGVDRTVSLYLSDSSMEEEDDDNGNNDDDEEMARRTRRLRQQRKENDKRINNTNINVENGEEGQQSDLVCIKEHDEKRTGENDEASADENKDNTIMEIIYQAWIKAHWAFQVVATISSCFWTYALINGGSDADDIDDALIWDPQIAIMVVLVLTGVTCPLHLFAPIGVGVFAGAVPRTIVPNYMALTVLAICSAMIWRIVAYTQFLTGFGGRMGTTTFIAMNITAITFLIPFGYMQDGWNAYGQANWTSRSDDDDSDSVLSFEWDKAVVFVGSTVFLSVAGATFRIRTRQNAPPVHPFLTPCAVALASDLVVAATVSSNNHRLASTAYVGFSIGSYVAMAALTNLPNKEIDFGLAGLTAGLLGILIDPFFVDFGGKAGFTAFLGYSTYRYIIMPLVQWLLRPCTPKQPDELPQ